MKRIDETLKKIAANTSRENSHATSNTEPARSASLPGDPNCPICGGIGFIRQDLPLGHPDFGRVQVCICRQTQAASLAYQQIYQVSNLEAFADKTFDTFKTQGRVGLGDHQVASLKQAYDQALHYAQTLKGWLLLTGGYGVGKSHLAAAVANYAVSLGVPVLFLTVPDLLDWLRAAFNNPAESFDERLNEILNVRLLVLDDLGTQSATPWAQEKLYQILNHRYVKALPTVVTTNQDLGEIDGRIRSRLCEPELVTSVRINAPDYRDPLGRDSTQPRLSSLDLYSRCTFGSFSLREQEKLAPEDQCSLEKAFAAAQQFAENPQGWLVLTGTFGCGKTHLAAAIANYRSALGKPCLFVVVPDLLDHLRSTFNPNSGLSYDKMFDEVRSAPLLVLDDLGTQSATPWAREKLYQIFNYRYAAELPTVITTSSRIEDLDPRITSRMLDGRLGAIYAILVPAFRLGAAPDKTRHPRKLGGTGVK